MPVELDLHLPRCAFTPRDVARPGDIWRAFQEAAVLGSSVVGWHPARYRAAGAAFVVRQMTAVHHREAQYGEAVRARTWVRTFRRGVITTRQIELSGDHGPIASCAQEWVHVSAALKPTRASAELQAAFPLEELADVAELPAYESAEGPSFERTLEALHLWMDPLGHANHPLYVDWADELLMSQLGLVGEDPHALAPVAERVSWKLGIEAPETLRLSGRLMGRTQAGDAVVGVQVHKGDGRLAAEATMVRRLEGRPSGRLVELLNG